MTVKFVPTLPKDVQAEEKRLEGMLESGEVVNGPCPWYGSELHDLYMYAGEPTCQRCGARWIDGAWVYRCKKCGKDVEPGELRGLFVPHLCKECLNGVVEDQRKARMVCPMCRQVFALCCC